jgi:hypothetical protein
MKKLILTFLLSFPLLMSMSFAQNAPSYEKDFASHLTDKDSEIYVRNPAITKDGKDVIVSSKNSLRDNIKIILSPGVTNSGFMANVIQVGAICLLIVYLVYAGVQLLIH